MKNKTKISISIFAIAIGSILTTEYSSSADANIDGTPAGRTGSLGDGGATCSSNLACHNTITTFPNFAPNPAITVPGLITSNIPLAGYTPGHTYTITGRIASPLRVRFGFEISPQNNAGTILGTLTITDTTTQLVSMPGGGVLGWVTHKRSGTFDSLGLGSKTWSFDWTAPAAGTGDVTFYGMFNIANNNASADGGDSLKKSTLLVRELSTGIDELNNISNYFSIYPNPITDKFFINNSINETGNMTVNIIDMNGKLVQKVQNVNSGQSINIEDLVKGCYFLRIETNKGEVVKKIVKE